MATETQTAFGECPTHGEVEGTRQIPKVSFPPIITAVQRTIAKRSRRYLCPACGAAVNTD
jgi:predicted RNA-binding Zn-ribbon protein involved in translation (DUF1610 family)